MKTLTLHPNPAHDQALSDLLTALGAVVTSNGDWLLNCGQVSENILIVVLPALDDAALTRAAGVAVAQGRRVVAIWAPGANGDLPQPIADYGGAAVTWSVDSLHRVLCDETPVWENAGGEDRGGQFTKRNVC